MNSGWRFSRSDAMPSRTSGPVKPRNSRANEVSKVGPARRSQLLSEYLVKRMALALPFAYLQVRAGGIAWKVFAGVMLGIGFHFLNGLFAHLGLLNTWPAWLSVSIPGVAAFVLALAMLAWVDRT